MFHVLITCGEFRPEGDFLELPQFDMERLLVAWQETVFELYLAEEKIEPEVVENMRSWEHSGFSVDQSVFLPAGRVCGSPVFFQLRLRLSLQNTAELLNPDPLTQTGTKTGGQQSS